MSGEPNYFSPMWLLTLNDEDAAAYRAKWAAIADAEDAADPTRMELRAEQEARRSDPFLNRFVGETNRDRLRFDVPWISHIEGNLYVGGCESGLVLPEMFKTVVSLYKWERYTVKHEGVHRTEVRMLDDSTPPIFEQVLDLARTVRMGCKEGPTLVHCQAGLNRSNLIAGSYLILEGRSASEAISLLRERRSPVVLFNKTFEDFLYAFEQRLRK